MPHPAPSPADLVAIYECLCDETRLRILNLLLRGPLCVCHIQDVIGLPQVQVSKHLGYLRRKGVVAAARHQNWMLYSLPQKKTPELEANLKCLQDCAQTHPIFKGDLKQLARLAPEIEAICCASQCAGVQRGAARPRKSAEACCN